MKKTNIVFNVIFLVILFNSGSAFSSSNDEARKKQLQKLNFGDYSSTFLVQKAWSFLATKDFDIAAVYANKIIKLYSLQAKKMQNSLEHNTDHSWKSKQKIFDYWALNDVGTALFILADTYRNAGQNREADKLYQIIINEYSYAQCWNQQGWFWKPSEAAQKRLDRW
jgi:hypothetical protein